MRGWLESPELPPGAVACHTYHSLAVFLAHDAACNGSHAGSHQNDPMPRFLPPVTAYLIISLFILRIKFACPKKVLSEAALPPVNDCWLVLDDDLSSSHVCVLVVYADEYSATQISLP